MPDVSAADWVAAGIGEFGSGVRGLIPAEFDSYARILHPAGSREGKPVAWSTVAPWSGRTLHAVAQFELVRRPRPGAGGGEPPFAFEPPEGEPEPELLSALCEVLARNTSTPGRCWFCLWDGWGEIEGSPAAVVMLTSGERAGESLELPPAFGRDVGGPQSLVDELCADAWFEAWAVGPDDPVDASSDRINGSP
jgi:hypothetical protein